MSPLSHSTFSTPASTWLRRASASISSSSSSPYALPAGPTRRADSSTSMPPPEPRSRTVSPSCSSATAVGLPQPSDASTAVSGSSPRCSAAYRPAPNSWRCSSVITAASGPQHDACSSPAATRAAAAYRARTASRVLLHHQSPIHAARGRERLGLDVVVGPQAPGARSPTRPASRSFFRWCDSVDCPMSKSGTSSQTQTLPACLRSTSTSWTRTGSPSALATSASRIACSTPTSGRTSGSQHGSPTGRFCFGARTRSTLIDVIAYSAWQTSSSSARRTPADRR